MAGRSDSSEMVAPAYEGWSLADVVPGIARALGAPVAETGLVLPEAHAYLLLLVDGLGYELLREHAEHAPYLAGLARGSHPLTVGLPSTTATSLTTLGTGLPPGEHGIVGFTSRIPGTHELLNALQWSKAVDPEEWQPHPTLFARLEAAGVATTVVNKREFAGSGLSQAHTRGATYVGADKFGERMVAVQNAVGLRPSLTYLYDGDLDWTGHRYGTDSPQWLAQLGVVDAVAQHVRTILPEEVRMVVVADHGMVTPEPADRIDVDEHPELVDGVALLGGEARFRHLYCQAGAVDDVLATWSEVLGDRAQALTRHQAIERGWFGEVDPRVRPRLGDVVVAARGETVVLSSKAFEYETTLVGYHGSFTRAEMLVPLLVD